MSLRARLGHHLRTRALPPAERVRAAAGRAALRAAARLNRRSYLPLDYPHEASGRPRWGHGRPANAQLEAVIARHADAYRDSLRRIAAQREGLQAIEAWEPAPGEPYWLSSWLPGLDAAALYAFLRERAPARYVEVGAGVSTAFAARARRDGGLSTHITAIDPAPRAPIRVLLDEWVAAPLQHADLSLFADLGPGDVVFVDGSHRALPNSDVVAFHLEVLPALPPGVLVGVHDVFLPEDYPPAWRDWHYSEQYLLAAWLLAESPRVRPVLAAWWASGRPDLARLTEEVWEDPRLERVERRGWGFWFEVDGG
jgi:predicted O-methyltransferase YrrM